MARDIGTATFTPSTGVKSVNIGVRATDMIIIFKGPGILPAEFHIAGGYQYGYSDDSTVANTFLRVKNTSGSVILEGTWTSFGATHANFNITTQIGTVPQMLMNIGY